MLIRQIRQRLEDRAFSCYFSKGIKRLYAASMHWAQCIFNALFATHFCSLHCLTGRLQWFMYIILNPPKSCSWSINYVIQHHVDSIIFYEFQHLQAFSSCGLTNVVKTETKGQIKSKTKGIFWISLSSMLLMVVSGMVIQSVCGVTLHDQCCCCWLCVCAKLDAMKEEIGIHHVFSCWCAEKN